MVVVRSPAAVALAAFLGFASCPKGHAPDGGPSLAQPEAVERKAREAPSPASARRPSAAPAPAPVAPLPAAPLGDRTLAPVVFSAQVQPVLEAGCRPCHFAGGKMYAQLPFDRPETIRLLGERLFTRITDPEAQALIRAFLAQKP